MPFANPAQEKACWAQYSRDKKAGRKPKWNCHEWAGHKHSNSYPFNAEKDQRLHKPKKEDQERLKYWIKDLPKRKTYMTVCYLFVFVIGMVFAATWASGEESSDVNFRYGKFFEWFSIIFIPGITLINILFQLPYHPGLQGFELVVASFFVVYWLRGGKQDLSKEGYIEAYIIAAVWSVVSIQGLSHEFRTFNWLTTCTLDLGVLAMLVGGGIGLKYGQRSD